MSQQITSNFKLNAPLSLDNRTGVLESGTWRPYNSVQEFLDNNPSLGRPETLIFFVRSSDDNNLSDLYIIGKNKAPYLFKGQAGYDGWTMQFAPVTIGITPDYKVGLRLIDYVGGTGTKPTAYIGEYLKPDGQFSSNPSDAQNIRGDKGEQGEQGIKGDKGEQGIKGDNGWTAEIAEIAYSDGFATQVVDWFGGEGDKPNTGMYIGATGFVEDIEDATISGRKGDKGEQGEQGEQGIKGDKGDIPDHEWDGTDLRFENPDGSWGNYVDLKGEQGQQGQQGPQGIAGISTTNMTTQYRILGSDGSTVPSAPKQLEPFGMFLNNQRLISGWTGSGSSSEQYRVIKLPVGGIVRISTGFTGALQIKMPSATANVLGYIRGTLYTYIANGIGSQISHFNIAFNLANLASGSRAVITSDLNQKYTVRWHYDTTTNNKYIYIGELNFSWGATSALFVVDEVVYQNAAATMGLAMTPLEVSLQSANFIGTQNAIQTDTRPQFNPAQIMSEYTLGVNTPFANTDSFNQLIGKAQGQINARLTQPQGDTRYNGKSIYNATNGILITTDIPDNTDCMFNVRFETNGYGTSRPGTCLLQGYMYLITGSTIIFQTGAVLSGESNSLGGNIHIFKEGGFLKFWLNIASVGNFRSLTAYCWTTRDILGFATREGADKGNRITSIANVAKPTTGVSGEVTVTPARTLLNTGTSSQIVLGDGSYQELSSLPAFTATKFATPRNINGVAFDGTSNIVVADSTKIPTTEKGANNGVATLGSDGKVPTSQLPDVTITDTFVVNTQTAMLALTAQVGDVCVRTDINQTFILRVEPATTLGNWTQLLTPTSDVTSVAGKTGAVVLNKADVGLGNVDNTSDVNKPISTATSTALTNKLDKTGGTLTGELILSSSTPSGNLVATSKKYVDDSVSAATLTAGNNIGITGGAINVVEDSTHRFVTDTLLTKLNGIQTEATANQTDAYLLNRANHTGTQTADTITDGTTNKVFTSTEKTKLAGLSNYSAGNQIEIAGNTIAVKEDSTHRFVTDAEKLSWNDKATIITATLTPASNLFSTSYKDYSVTGASVGDFVIVENGGIFYNSSLAAAFSKFELWGKVVATDTVRIGVRTLVFDAGSTDVSFSDAFLTAQTKNLSSSDFVIKILK